MQMLTLQIKKKWFDMILSGEKKEEYREIKPYYEVRMQNTFGLIIVEIPDGEGGMKQHFLQGNDVPEEIREEPVQEIIFKNGYAKDSPSLIAKCTLRIGQGRKEWGAEPGKEYFILDIQEVR